MLKTETKLNYPRKIKYKGVAFKLYLIGLSKKKEMLNLLIKIYFGQLLPEWIQITTDVKQGHYEVENLKTSSRSKLNVSWRILYFTY